MLGIAREYGRSTFGWLVFRRRGQRRHAILIVLDNTSIAPQNIGDTFWKRSRSLVHIRVSPDYCRLAAICCLLYDVSTGLCLSTLYVGTGPMYQSSICNKSLGQSGTQNTSCVACAALSSLPPPLPDPAPSLLFATDALPLCLSVLHHHPEHWY
jgi:hypothetical protein